MIEISPETLRETIKETLRENSKETLRQTPSDARENSISDLTRDSLINAKSLYRKHGINEFGDMSGNSHTVRVPFLNGEIAFGSGDIALIAGPCAIESQDIFEKSALAVRQAGACFLRGGIFKMRTSRDSFQGIGEKALEFINETKLKTKMPLVSEVTDPRQIESLANSVEMFQVGSRNMYNYELLKELGSINKPVLLKRAFAATVDEWLKAADYLVKGGNSNVILCERGIRTFESTTRNTLDLNSVAYLKAHTNFPVIVDPSHGTGRPELIGPMSLAAIAAGADGLIIEVHPCPKESLSDAHQALSFTQFEELTTNVKKVASALGRKLVAGFPQ